MLFLCSISRFSRKLDALNCRVQYEITSKLELYFADNLNHYPTAMVFPWYQLALQSKVSLGASEMGPLISRKLNTEPHLRVQNGWMILTFTF